MSSRFANTKHGRFNQAIARLRQNYARKVVTAATKTGHSLTRLEDALVITHFADVRIELFLAREKQRAKQVGKKGAVNHELS